MLKLIETDKALASMDRYFTMLSNTGYVKQGTLNRYMLFLFIIDFVDCLYYFMTDEDYEKINRLLLSIFSGGGCLLPYKLHCQYRVVFGLPHTVVGLPLYVGSFRKRITETSSDRISEQNRMRAV